ncbi:MAG: GyrI-like domain-containing protein [Terricaulis sp.]
MSVALASDALLPLLVHIQANLDTDLSLARLSRRAGVSPSHFHRTFRAEVGETLADYVARLRLERAAFRLHVQEASVLQIALECGYQTHETFTRAFRRAFGKTPSAYRLWRRRAAAVRAPSRTAPQEACPFALSATKVVRLRQMNLAFIRHVGPYENVSDALFDDLEAWAQRQRLPGPRVWLGVGHDAPSTTPPARLRFDAALAVDAPFPARGRVAHQVIEAGEFATTTHVGPFDSLPDAYLRIFERVVSLKGYVFVGLPAVEFYRSVRVNTRLRLSETQICLPVRRIGR